MADEWTVRAKYKPNNSYEDGLGALMMSAQCRRPAVEAAHAALLVAKALATRLPPNERSSGARYIDSFEVDGHTPPVFFKDGKNSNPRLGAALVNTARHAGVIEFGKGGNGSDSAAHRILGNTAKMIGEYRP